MCDPKQESKKTKGLDISSEDMHQKGSVFHELYLEFFAVFIPGFVLVAGILALLSLFHYSIWRKPIIQFALGADCSYAFFCLAILAYAVGAVLHRQRPDQPDEISALLQYKLKSDDLQGERSNDETGAVFFKSAADDFSIFALTWYPILYLYYRKIKVKYYSKDKDDKFIKYPYDFLRRYLLKHGLVHLLEFAPWCPHIKETDIYRSRVTINELKTITKRYGPKSFSSEQVRHESNIRLFTSLWHALKILLILLGILLILAALIFLCCTLGEKSIPELQWITSFFCDQQTGTCLISSKEIAVCKEEFFHNHICLFIVWGLIFCGIIILKHGIERALHYLRLKEIVTIFQQAYILKKQLPENPVWYPVRKRNQVFRQKINCHTIKNSFCSKQYCCFCLQAMDEFDKFSNNLGEQR